jgi:N-acylneuraminate cytidylyltransferase
MIDIVAIIPARSGSKGVPDKNIKLLAGKPLIAYSIASAQLTDNIQRVIVSTDSERYAEIALEYGAETPFLRPAELSVDSCTDYDVLKHTLDWLQVNEGFQPEYLVYLRPVTPLRDITIIKSAIERIKMDNDATALRSMHEMPETAYKTLEIEGGYLKCICSGSFDIDAANLPRQTYEKTYVANGYVDIIRSSFVIENEKVFGNRVIAYITPVITDIDTLEDFEYLEYQAAKDHTVVSRLFQ